MTGQWTESEVVNREKNSETFFGAIGSAFEANPEIGKFTRFHRLGEPIAKKLARADIAPDDKRTREGKAQAGHGPRHPSNESLQQSYQEKADTVRVSKDTPGDAHHSLEQSARQEDKRKVESDSVGRSSSKPGGTTKKGPILPAGSNDRGEAKFTQEAKMDVLDTETARSKAQIGREDKGFSNQMEKVGMVAKPIPSLPTRKESLQSISSVRSLPVFDSDFDSSPELISSEPVRRSAHDFPSMPF